jgi:hypothetical protein
MYSIKAKKKAGIMVRTLVAYYKDVATAQHVIDALLDAGFSGDDISLLVNNSRSTDDFSSTRDISTGQGAGFGALVGVLVGIGASLMPGIGPGFGSGVVAALLTVGISAAAGALTGGITAGVLDLSETEAASGSGEHDLYHFGPVVTVSTNDQWAEWAEKILVRYQPQRLEQRQVKWYNSEWGASQADVDEHNTEHQSDSKLRIPRLPPASQQQGAKHSSRLPGSVQIYDN